MLTILTAGKFLARLMQTKIKPTEYKLEHNRVEILPTAVVCLVDDDPSVRKSGARLLEAAGFKVHVFGEPESFLAHLAIHSVPVVLLDIWMEGMTGMEVLAHLCARSPQTRVIFITGHEDHGAQATVMQAGAFAFLIKPFDGKQLLALVRRALETFLPGGNS